MSWYARQFGDTSRFAVKLSFSEDPHPVPGLRRDLAGSWGALEIWARGRCLTRSTDNEGGQSDGVVWYLLPFLEWIAQSASRLLNEEPFPRRIAREDVPNACVWLDQSEEPALTLTEDEEESWFESRSSWRERHALRSGFQDAAFPMVLIRRAGDNIEVSWDNRKWGTSRPTVTFSEAEGTALVEAEHVVHPLAELLTDVPRALAARAPTPRLNRLLERISKMLGSQPDWRWLLHEDTVRVLEDMPEIHSKLSDSGSTKGLLARHTELTHLLRSVRATRPRDIEKLADALSLSGNGLSDLERYRSPSIPDPDEPWGEGYEAAIQLRENLGWGSEPLPNLGNWLDEMGTRHHARDMGEQVDLVSVIRNGHSYFVANPDTGRGRRQTIALPTGLGHLLMDPEGASVDGTWEYWPQAARARAFAAMLLMPEEGVRRVLRKAGGPTVDGVKRVMDVYGTGARAATWHLFNIKIIDDEERESILLELQSET